MFYNLHGKKGIRCSINESIFSKFEQIGLDYNRCLIGMGFDGASVVRGRLGGVQKLIKDKNIALLWTGTKSCTR